MSWFGNLDLAYKYTTVFGALLVLTILAGFCKVLYNRRRLKNFSKAQPNVEAGPTDDEQMELNQREKDEGDLFGIRAIEAGFYAGIPQSRPTSRAGSFVGGPGVNSNALIGSLSALKMNTNSMASSVTSLPLAHTPGGNRDSDYLPDSPPRRKGPPTITLRPSEAEMNGRINHNGAVNMALNVPPSPVLARAPRSPTFNGSDGSDSDNGRHSPPSANFRQDHYAPVPPQLPMPELLRVSVHSAEDMYTSQAASFNDPSPSHSPPSSPGHAPTTKLPSMPGRAAGDEPQPHTGFPVYSERRSSLPRIQAHGVGAQQHYNEPTQPSSSVLLQPQAYQPTHQRDMSNASSVYSENRMSTLEQRNRSDSAESGYSYSYNFPETSNRNSIMQPKEQPGHRKSVSSSLLDPNGSATSNQSNDPRFSEFYDAYYRHSQLGPASKADASKRPNQLNLSDQTIVEVPTPLASPAVHPSHHQPGFAM
ncbi:hypothetical protein K505DRAFT_361588 [Melanomma pulvis-pyrius CBS 109.77]|uniref:Uncharacterized protein n=1 Tax=Melanomma pulvis-pyrius CBS 109.77 TaxID=1314802 RepID=A0A6A6XBQ4_9PLEO|nr:hypothetical protein K505DRAFT_361588 [Melanomma pulvis-pyrius CBS 109.77]